MRLRRYISFALVPVLGLFALSLVVTLLLFERPQAAANRAAAVETAAEGIEVVLAQGAAVERFPRVYQNLHDTVPELYVAFDSATQARLGALPEALALPANLAAGSQVVGDWQLEVRDLPGGRLYVAGPAPATVYREAAFWLRTLGWASAFVLTGFIVAWALERLIVRELRKAEAGLEGQNLTEVHLVEFQELGESLGTLAKVVEAEERVAARADAERQWRA
ncbi:MAG: hypothetical protein Q7P63_15455 [Verrucomicrobiota bacterium JB022]|nr:hypothetical protein [Verrucomicrobiota bacterium JB022]